MEARLGSVVDELERILAPGQVGAEEVSLRRYAVDQAPVIDFQLPLAVVFPESVEEVQAVVRACAESGTAVVPRGAGTGVSGGAHATRNCVVLSLERMDRILALNPDDETAMVEPGVVNAVLNDAAAEHGLMYAPDPASFRSSTIGGNVATNAGDGNLHPTFWIDRTGNGVDAGAMERLQRVLDESITAALAMGGTITGEHGVGQYKLRWLGQEQPEPVRELQRRIKALFDPAGILNPGKAI